MTDNLMLKEYVKKENVYIAECNSAENLFKYIYKKLYKEGLVKESFLDGIINRENEYPTGLDLSHVSETLPSIALPHTECESVCVDQVIPIRLTNGIIFNDMINPSQEQTVEFVFMILNSNVDSQSQILPAIMDFIRTKTPEELLFFFNLNDEEKIYDFIRCDK